MNIKNTFIVILLSVITIILMNCHSPKESKIILFSSKIPPNHAKILGVISKIEPVYYKSIVTSGTEELTKAGRLFEEGMDYYIQKDYTNAIEKLKEFIDQNYDDANTHFYLGLCYLLNQKSDEAIYHFKKTLNLGCDGHNEECH